MSLNFNQSIPRSYLASVISEWDRIKSPAADQIIPYDDLPVSSDPKILDKLAVLKVNGGLGTSMGAQVIYIYRKCIY